jgi:hypothetical protein
MMMMLAITHTLTANGPGQDEQQGVSLSGHKNSKFKQDPRPELSLSL